MSLVSLYWDKEYNTASKIPAEWEIPYTNDVFNGVNRLYTDFSPQVISYRIKDTFLFPVRRPYRRRYKRLKINTSQYFNIGYNLFI